ncbi:hypothetical protein CFIMG_007717RA00001 [Ceratocystis fimbriata CBS 114723]|uniref:Uncharacterized protein n=1 Tax=Ceratocystis fimbriata CBS 114723 TaxID=1035309 RepID=A0A2C5WVE7_9PEZI|nr:hypothetical protein CFIMG_007717RA00001 [Ceratocystis fimbriata CBS 114723]
MQPWIATVFLALASKAVMAVPSPEYTPEPAPVYVDCEWVARVCWCTNINGYSERVSDDWCFNIQDDEDWEENHGKKEEPTQYSDDEWDEESEEEEEQ